MAIRRPPTTFSDTISTADIADDAITGGKLANDIAISTTGNIATTGSGALTVAGNTTLSGTNNLGSNPTLTLGTNTTFPDGMVVNTITSEKTDTTDINGATATGYFDISGLSATLTPASGNKILVHVQMVVGTQSHQQGILMKVLRDIGGGGYTEINYRGNSSDNRARVISGFEESGQHEHDIQYTMFPLNAQFLDAPSTASAVTYKVQFMVQHAGSYGFVNRTGNDGNNSNMPRGASSITLMEIQQ